MTHEEGVLNIIKELNGLKEKRKKIQEELKAIEARRAHEIVDPELKLESELREIKSSIFNSPYVYSQNEVLVDDRYDREYPVTLYLIGNVIVGGGLSGGIYATALNTLEDLTEEERIQLISKNIDPQIKEERQKLVEKEKSKKELDEKLAGLYAERATTPWYAFAKKRQLEKEIKYLEKEIEKIESSISKTEEYIKVLEKEQNSNKDTNQILKSIDELIEKIKLYEVKTKELENMRVKLQKDDKALYQEYKEKEEELKETAKAENELIVELAKSSNNVKALEKISKDPNVDEETREVASKLIKVIAKQYKEQKNNRK